MYFVAAFNSQELVAQWGKNYFVFYGAAEWEEGVSNFEITNKLRF